MNISVKIFTRKNIGLLIAGLFVVGAAEISAVAQRDPFAKPVVRSSAPKKATGTKTEPKKAPTTVGVPSIQQRIDSYKAIRMACAERGIACPKPTSVLTVDEMQVTGIFRTPRGYAAMVEATPIKLSYTIYPGEKFYDGQLVAIEESKLIFRRTRRLSDGKEAVAVDTKVLRQAGVNDMAGRSEQQISPTVTAAAPAATQGLSAEAVSTESKGDGAAASPVVNANSRQQATVSAVDKAVKEAVAPAAESETAGEAKTEAAPAKPKTKGKSKRQK
jgi:hypothetical protein